MQDLINEKLMTPKVEKKKPTDAKVVSKWAMILGCLLFFIQYIPYLVLSLIHGQDLDMNTCLIFLFAGMTPAIIFTPVYFQLFMDKLIALATKRHPEEK